jgi:hypothetical protein
MTIVVDITSSNPTEFLLHLMTTAFHAKSSSPAKFLPYLMTIILHFIQNRQVLQNYRLPAVTDDQSVPRAASLPDRL